MALPMSPQSRAAYGSPRQSRRRCRRHSLRDATGSPAMLYLEDLKPGDIHKGEARASVTTDTIKTFAREYEPQPFHTDETAAAKSLFGGLAASGWHTAATT